MFRNGFIFVVAFIVISGCTSMKRNYAPEEKKLNYPEINKIKTVNVGDKIISKGRYYIVDLLNIKKESGGVHYDIPAGMYLKVGMDESKNYYDIRGRGVTVRPNSLGDHISGMYTMRSGAKEVCVITVSHSSICYDADYVESKTDVFNDNSYLFSLIYGGKHGKAIQITFVEQFRKIGGTTHNIEYEVQDGGIIQYRGAKILVIQSTPNSLTYKVLSSFKEQLK